MSVGQPRKRKKTITETVLELKEKGGEEDEFSAQLLEKLIYFASVFRRDDADLGTYMEAWKDFKQEQKEKKRKDAEVVPLTMFHPGGRGRLAMDLLGGIMIIYDLFMIPVALSFGGTGPNDFVEPWFLSWTTLTFWTVEMFCSFNTAFYDRQDRLVISRTRIAIRHIKSWFIVDVLTLGPEWLEIFLSRFLSQDGGDGGADLGFLLCFF